MPTSVSIAQCGFPPPECLNNAQRGGSMSRTGPRFVFSRSSLQELIAFYLLFAAVAGLAFWLVHSYLDIIAFSLTAVIILKPLYDRVLTQVGGRAGLAEMLTLCAFLLAVIVLLA